MKNTLSTLALILSLHSFAQLSGNSEYLESKDLFRTPMTSGQVSYVISGEVTGYATLYFDRNGWRQLLVKEITIEKYGMKTVEKTVQFTDGDQNYIINIKANKGTSSVDDRWSKLAAYKPKDAISEIILQNDGGVKNGDTTILEKSVVIWDFNQSTTIAKWIWKGIELKEFKSLVGLKYEMTATKIEENTSFPEALIPHSAIITQ